LSKCKDSLKQEISVNVRKVLKWKIEDFKHNLSILENKFDILDKIENVDNDLNLYIQYKSLRNETNNILREYNEILEDLFEMKDNLNSLFDNIEIIILF